MPTYMVAAIRLKDRWIDRGNVSLYLYIYIIRCSQKTKVTIKNKKTSYSTAISDIIITSIFVYITKKRSTTVSR